MKFREFSIERDEQNMPTKLIWRSDYELPAKQTQAQKDAEKLAEYESVYGKRVE